MTTAATTWRWQGLGRPRLPVMLQTEAAECALACLAMIAAWHGLHSDLPTLRRRVSLSLKGATMADLVRMAGDLQLAPRPLRAELEHLGQLELPCILHWDMNHFVVLKSVGRSHVEIHDPARGVRRLTHDELSRHFTGVVLELTPEADFRPRVEREPLSLARLLGRVTGLKRSLLQIFALALALEAFALLSPFFMQWVVDGVLLSADRSLLVTLGVGFAMLVVIQVATGALRSWAVLHLASTLNVQWVANVFAHLLRLPMAWFEKRHTGDVMSRFGAIQQIQQTLTTHFIEAVLDGVLVVVTLAMMALYSATLTAIVLAAVAIYALLRQALFRALRNATEEEIAQEARRATHFLESLAGVQAIKLFNRRADRQARFTNIVVDAMNATVAVRRIELALQVSHKLLFGLERVAVIWIGALLVMEGGLTVGMLFAFIAFKEQFATRVSGLIDKAAELQMLRLQAERLSDIVLAAPESEGGAMPAGAAEPAPRLELRDVSFRYADGEPDVIAGCSLVIEPGESVAIVGPSGCGKTTLLKLMLGVQVPQSGAIEVGGICLQRLGLARWRDMIGTVMQDETLFAGTIADNICFFDADPDPAWIAECARLASVDAEIEALTMGYHTLIGSLGASLSGGQRQRILLARALYKRPRILFLDEATSALDVDRERLVNRAVARLALTRVIVAHRPETIASADRVIVLQQGAAHSLQQVQGGRGPHTHRA
ncbi:MAG: peptidase domain-containing ABC transporter [Ideonella sp.]|nr:peptidase domain-containing ABC transporter [Ideonella sp.]